MARFVGEDRRVDSEKKKVVYELYAVCCQKCGHLWVTDKKKGIDSRPPDDMPFWYQEHVYKALPRFIYEGPCPACETDVFTDAVAVIDVRMKDGAGTDTRPDILIRENGRLIRR